MSSGGRGESGNKLCNLCATSSAGAQQQVDKALSLIGKKFKDLDLTNLYAPPPPPLTLPSLPMTSWVRMASPQ